jgi:hypothetical protein
MNKEKGVPIPWHARLGANRSVGEQGRCGAVSHVLDTLKIAEEDSFDRSSFSGASLGAHVISPVFHKH